MDFAKVHINQWASPNLSKVSHLNSCTLCDHAHRQALKRTVVHVWIVPLGDFVQRRQGAFARRVLVSSRHRDWNPTAHERCGVVLGSASSCYGCREVDPSSLCYVAIKCHGVLFFIILPNFNAHWPKERDNVWCEQASNVWWIWVYQENNVWWIWVYQENNVCCIWMYQEIMWCLWVYQENNVRCINI